jgi:hypothetical protein
MERKNLLDLSSGEGGRLNISRYIPEQGKAFFELARGRELGGRRGEAR